MIIGVSIVDLHKPEGHRHVGTYMFEIDYPIAQHPGQMEFFTVDASSLEAESHLRPHLNKLQTADQIDKPIYLDGTPVKP